MDKISIIIPAYNAGRYLAETLDSVLKQTFQNFEVIIIDDGSLDNTYSIMEEYKNKSNKIFIFQQENQGQSATRNNAMKLVTGEYVMFLDADDILVDDCLERLFTQIEKDQSDICICGYEKFYDKTNQVFYTRLPALWEIKFDYGISHVFHYSPCAKLYKTDFIKKYDLKFSVGEQLEDGPYSCLANLLANKVSVLDYIGYRYRTYESSTMGTVRAKNSKPKPPYQGVKTLIYKFRKFNKDSHKDQVMEYCVTKILAGFTTNMYKNVDKTSRKEICSYCHAVMQENFPLISKNPYIKISKLSKLPLTHRIAVRLFVFFNKINCLYPFSLLLSKVL